MLAGFLSGQPFILFRIGCRPQPCVSIVLLFLALVTPGFGQAIDNVIRKALDGDAASQISLGERYRVGIGVARNYQESLRFYKLAAAQGVSEAQFALAEMYRF